MRPELAVAVAVMLWLLTILSGCTTAPAPDAPAPAAPAAQSAPPDWLSAPGQALALDGARSRIEVRVYRGGRLAHLGHNHVLEVLGLRGRLQRLESGAGVADLVFRPQQMRVDHGAARARAGDDFAQMPDAAAIAGTRRNMLGANLLNAARWPEVHILARVADLGASESAADVFLQLRGSGRRYQLPLSIEKAGEEIRVSGSLRLRQSDFGIPPFSVLGGALQVRDEIEVDFLVVGRNSRGAM